MKTLSVLTIIHVPSYNLWGSQQSQAREGQEIRVSEAAAEIMGREGDLTAPYSKEHGTPVGGDGGHPSALSPQFSCVSVPCTPTQVVQGHQRMVLRGPKSQFPPSPRCCRTPLVREA